MANSRLYVIELKDAETGISEFVTTVDWTANQKLVAVTMFQPSECDVTPIATKPTLSSSVIGPLRH